MFSMNAPIADDSVIRPIGDDDQRLLLGLVHKYGLSSLMCALTGLGESSRNSTVSATTLLSNTSAPSLVWTASDAASIRTQSTRGELAGDVASIHDSELGKPYLPERQSWLESPCAITSPHAQDGSVAMPASPRLHISTLKKYQCPMCFLDRNLVEFGRKSDFKKHLNNFHGTDVVWICRSKGCYLSFATERAYSTHAKETHRMEALPSSAARTELCPQLAFACGFNNCKDRIFEATTKDDAASSRDKYFEHIAKHFEDDYDVNEWEYRVQIHNLMRQNRVKSIWKSCIWPKEKRQQLSWRPRSSGDLKRMLECRHLGEDISQLVRLAYILGTAPFTSSRTPPPSEIDMHFQLPYRSQCLLETADAPAKEEDSNMPTLTSSKSRPQSLFRLPSRKGRNSKTPRPSTPASIAGSDTPMSGSDITSAPHPGTPIPIPQGRSSFDGPKFAPDQAPQLPKQMNTPVSVNSGCETPVSGSPAMFSVPMHHGPDDQAYYYGAQAPTSMPEGIVYSPYEQPLPHPQDAGSRYSEMMFGCTPQNQNSMARPATPVPHKRPASWGRVTSMEEMRPKKKPSTPTSGHYRPESPVIGHGEPLPMNHTLDNVPNAYGEMIPTYHTHPPTSVPPEEWALPMRMGTEPQGGFQDQHHHYAPVQQEADPMTFFFDDTEGRM